MQDLLALVVVVLLRVFLPLLLLGGLAVLCFILARSRWRRSYRSGDLVAAGLYWNPRTLALHSVPNPTGVLPGGRGQRWLPAPVGVAAVAAPLLGLLYILLLPLAMFGFVLWLIVRAIYGRLRRPVASEAMRERRT